MYFLPEAILTVFIFDTRLSDPTYKIFLYPRAKVLFYLNCVDEIPFDINTIREIVSCNFSLQLCVWKLLVNEVFTEILAPQQVES